jgi:hypothetical protein
MQAGTIGRPKISFWTNQKYLFHTIGAVGIRNVTLELGGKSPLV